MDPFAQIVNGFITLTAFLKNSISNVWLGSEYLIVNSKAINFLKKPNSWPVC